MRTKKDKIPGALMLAFPLALALAFLFGPSTALASKQVFAFFGTQGASGTRGGDFNSPGDIAVNSTGAGGVPAGTIYVADERNFRIERFSKDDNGTPSVPYDDSFPFVSAWGAGVLTAGTDFEICNVAADCHAGVTSAGNGTVAGDGGFAAPFSSPHGLAVDQDTGEVYAGDPGSARINVYAAGGTFLRSFGWDVVASGPDDAGSGYETCIAANGDVCKAGASGAGMGQLGSNFSIGLAISPPDGNAATGKLFVTDGKNARVDTYGLDGSSLGSFGTPADFSPQFNDSPFQVAVDSRGIVYLADRTGGFQIDRYDTTGINGQGVGFLEPIPGSTVLAAGGPGDFSGSHPYTLTFRAGLRRTDVPQVTVSSGTTPLSGGSGASVTTLTPGGPGADEIQQLTVSATQGQFRLTFEGQTTGNIDYDARPDQIEAALQSLSSVPETALLSCHGCGSEATAGLEVDPAGDALYVLRHGVATNTVIQQFGPLNSPGLTAPPSAVDDLHGANVGFSTAQGLGLDTSSGQLFVATAEETATGPASSGIYVLDMAGGQATATLASLSDITPTSVTVHGTVDPSGPPDAFYHLEYSLDGTSWRNASDDVVVGSQASPQAIDAVLEPLAGGLLPGTAYHVRIVATRPFNRDVVTPELTFTTLADKPLVETVGSPVRTATTAQLEGRVDPRGANTAYHFEYGTAGPCDANPCTSSAAQPIGSGNLTRLVAQDVNGLSPGVTYHYRLVADNGMAGSPTVGADRAFTTRASDSPLDHGSYPGPPGSDRAWEQVNVPETGGNPIFAALAVSDSGERVAYQLAGGSPATDTGSAFNLLFAQRPSGAHPTVGWQGSGILPLRADAYPTWFPPFGTNDLTSLSALNIGQTGFKLWRLVPGGSATQLFSGTRSQFGDFFETSDDGATSVALFKGSLVDPDHPLPPDARQLYEISSGTPHLLSFPPGNATPSCPVPSVGSGFDGGLGSPHRTAHWISPDGKLVFFPMGVAPSCSPSHLFVRDMTTDTTTRVDAPPLSGSDCATGFIKSTPGAVFFWTQDRLAAEDDDPHGCATTATDGDIYRRDLTNGELACLTCFASGLHADVAMGSGEAASDIGVAEDGSRVYFTSPNRLLPGAPDDGAYRVDVSSGNLAYVAPADGNTFGVTGDFFASLNALTPDGSVLIFSSSNSALDPIGGQTNGGTLQYYRYNDNDRSLICVSCPQDGSAPAVDAVHQLGSTGFASQQGPNISPLSREGDFAFATPNPLVADDQNTAGSGQDPSRGVDVYEWRDGRLLLVSDGTTIWPGPSLQPTVNMFSPSGRDLFFTESASLTPDALDGYNRLYDARIGGGIDFPPASLPPCDLNSGACEGRGTNPPDQPGAGSAVFSGPGNQPLKARKSRKKRRHRKHYKKRHHASHQRRVQR